MKLFKFLLLFFSLVFCVALMSSFSKFNFWKKHKAVQAYYEKDYEQALTYFHSLMDQDPYNPEYNYNVGDILYKQKKYQGAQHAFLRAAEKAISLSKLQEQALFNAANSSYQLKEWLQAVEGYQQVLKIDKDNQSAQHNLQLALSHLQQEQNKLDKDQQKDKQEKSADENEFQSQNDKKESDSSHGDDNEKNESGQNSQENQKNLDGDGVSKEKKSDQYDDKHDRKGENQQLDAQNQDEQKNQSLDDMLDKNSSDSKKSLDDKKESDDKNNSAYESDHKDNQEEQDKLDVAEQNSDNAQQDVDDKQEAGYYKKPELKNEFQDKYESKASDDERLDDYYACVMKTLEDLEEKVQKHVIKNKVAMQRVGQHEKKGW